MKKLTYLILMIGVFALVLAGCSGGKDKAPEKQKKTTMTDIINSSEKHAIVSGTDDNVHDIYITQNGKTKEYDVEYGVGDITLDDIKNKSVSELEKLGEKKQKEKGLPAAYYTDTNIYMNPFDDNGNVYNFRGYQQSKSVPEDTGYIYGTSEKDASKYFENIRDFHKVKADDGGKPEYEFYGVPKDSDPTKEDAQTSYPFYDIQNKVVTCDDGSHLAGFYGGENDTAFLLTKLTKGSSMTKEKVDDYKKTKNVKTY